MLRAASLLMLIDERMHIFAGLIHPMCKIKITLMYFFVFLFMDLDTMTCFTDALAIQLYIGSYEDGIQYLLNQFE